MPNHSRSYVARFVDEILYESCPMCGDDLEACDCPDCPTCEERGNPQCYLPYPYGHALSYHHLQYRSLERANASYNAARLKEDRFWDDEFILSNFNNSRDPWQYITYFSEEHRECLLEIAIAMNDHAFNITHRK